MNYHYEGHRARTSGELEVVEQERDNALLEIDRLHKRITELNAQMFQARLDLSKYERQAGFGKVVEFRRATPDGAA